MWNSTRIAPRLMYFAYDKVESRSYDDAGSFFIRKAGEEERNEGKVELGKG